MLHPSCVASYDITPNVVVPAGLVALAAYMPFSVLHFAIKGHEVWLESAWSGDSSTAAAPGPALAARPGSMDVSAWGGGSLPGSPAPRAPRTSASLEVFRLDPASRQGSGVPPAPGHKPVSTPGDPTHSGLPAGPATQQRRSVLSNVQHQYSGRSTGEQQRGVLQGVRRLLLRCATIVAAAAVGTVAYAVLLVVMVLALLWAWVTRTVFSVYCIFWPGAADTPCCLRLNRDGDFWGMADKQAAFTAAKLSVSHADQMAADSAGGDSAGGDSPLGGRHGFNASCSVSVAPRLA